MQTIARNLQDITARISAAAGARIVRLLGVSKGQPASALREAHSLGLSAFGESYVQEALEKQAALHDLPLEWHFIGPLQSNKTRAVAEHFAWVHSLDRLKIAQRLSEARPAGLPPLHICLQVNVSGEASKSGVSPADVAALARDVADLPRLRLRGLMTIPEPTSDPALQRARFAQLRTLLAQLNEAGHELDTLSMGMSADLDAAIREGATIVRVGTALFGARIRNAA